jgi:protein-disulfide isomerase
MKNEKITTPASIIISGVLIAASLYAGSFNLQAAPVKQDSIKVAAPVAKDVAPFSIQLAPITDSDHIIGSKDADVILVEYSDLECPFCKRYHETLKKIMAEYGESGKVAWVYRHYPIDQLHSKARKEAEATECAGDQGGNGAFWAYVDKVYATTESNNKLDLAELPKIAKELNLDVSEFTDCLTKGKFSDKIESEVQKAMSAGAKGTPYTVVLKGGAALPLKGGAISFEALKAQIEEALTKK